MGTKYLAYRFYSLPVALAFMTALCVLLMSPFQVLAPMAIGHGVENAQPLVSAWGKGKNRR